MVAFTVTRVVSAYADIPCPAIAELLRWLDCKSAEIKIDKIGRASCRERVYVLV